MDHLDLSVIIVNWNTKDLLLRCLESLRVDLNDTDQWHLLPDGRPLSFEVLVVDNASTDGSADMVAARFPQVRLLANETNAGFTKANNQAISLSQGQYVILLNSDAEIVGQAMETMVTYLDDHPEIGVVGPKLLNTDGSVQSSHRRFPTLATGFVESTILQRYFPRSRLLSRYYCLDLPADREQDVDWVVGACLMVRRTAIAEVGLLDDDFFMYSEELDWCWRIKKAGWKVAFLASAEVVHHYGKSSERDLPQRHIYFNDSKLKLYRKHFGLPAATALRLFILATYVFQVLEEGLKFLLGHKRPLRKERLGLLLRVLRSGLQA
ncbi:MAG: glycosyltransferase family 2 protein [Dehalococcoidia bacterium]|nr:glycosyltransferase family 2 protein [Dehalococcoidia bacterium]